MTIQIKRPLFDSGCLIPVTVQFLTDGVLDRCTHAGADIRTINRQFGLDPADLRPAEALVCDKCHAVYNEATRGWE